MDGTTVNFGELTNSQQRDYLAEAFGEAPEIGNETDSTHASGPEPKKTGENQPAAGSAGTEPAVDSTPAEPAEEDAQPAEPTGPAGDGATDESKLYTVEEFIALNPLEIDPARLPKDVRLAHSKYTQYFNSQIAPALRELEELRAYRDKAAQPQPEKKEDFLASVKAETARRLGLAEYDDLNADCGIIAQQVAAEFMQAKAEAATQQRRVRELQTGYAQTLNDLAAEDPNFFIVDKWAQDEIQRLPYASAQKIMNDLASGDPVKIKSVYRQFADKYAQLHAAPAASPAAATAAPKVTPPTVMPGSSSKDAEHVRDWSMDDFRAANNRDQARMLISAGFVDE